MLTVLKEVEKTSSECYVGSEFICSVIDRRGQRWLLGALLQAELMQD